MNFIFEICNDFFDFLFPRICTSCSEPLVHGENAICSKCIYLLPRTNYHLFTDNKISQLFWGKIIVEQATAFYFFHKESKFQNLIHQLKYKGKKEIGVELGKHFGATLKTSDYSKVDLLIPIPLHKSRFIQRGYNQSEQIALGMSEVLNIPIDTKSVIRNIATKTQTKKSRIERIENVKSIFKITQPQNLTGKHILLIDDVITTGATIEACAAEILQIENTKVSIAALAVAEH